MVESSCVVPERLLDNAPAAQKGDVISLHDEHGSCLAIKGDLEALTGHDSRSVIPGGTYQYVHPADIPELSTHHVARLEGRLADHWVVYRLRCVDGQYIWVQTHSHTTKHEGNVCLVATTRKVRNAPDEALISPEPL